MIFILVSIAVPILIYTGLPSLLRADPKRIRRYSTLLAVACFIYFISWYLPSPLIDGRDTAFMTHLIGGGVFAGLLWLYIVRVKSLQLSNFWVESASLFALVSSLGVLNELAELMAVETGIIELSLHDTSWDLAANTIGALLFYTVYKVATFVMKKL